MTKLFFELKNKDRQYIWHPFTDPEDKIIIPIVKAEGAILKDYQGRKFIDAVSSWWVNIIGHCEKYIAKKIYKQALQTDQIIFANFTHQPAIELAERIIHILPFPFSKIFFSDNGSTSVEVALKMSLQYWQGKRKKIVALKNSYHGDTFGAMSVSNQGVFTKPFQDFLFEVEFIDPPQENSPLPKIDWENVAVFIYEPLIQGAGGMRVYSAKKMSELLHIVKKSNTLLIADEVLTGFGRTGNMFASESLEVQPDFICLSKGITAGYLPLGVTAVSEKVDHLFNHTDKLFFFHGHSYTANPLACAAAIACLELLEKRKEEYQAKRIGINKLYHNFSDRISVFPQVKNIRICGTILAFDIDVKDTGYINPIARTLKEYALSKGVLLRPLGNTIYIMPPLAIKNRQLAKVFDVIKDTIKKT